MQFFGPPIARLGLLLGIALIAEDSFAARTPTPTPTATATATKIVKPTKTPTPTPTPSTGKKRLPISARRCANVIADLRDGVMHLTTEKKKFPFECYDTVSNARRNGFVARKKAEKKLLSGWYRVSLKLTSDSCNPNPFIGVGPVLFLQVNDSGESVAGSFCPSIGVYNGVRTGAGFTYTSVTDGIFEAGGGFCGDQPMKEFQFLEMTPAIANGPAYTVHYRTLKLCSDGDKYGRSCVQNYEGPAIHEIHNLWPKVSKDINSIGEGCGRAIQACSECHAELKSILAGN